VNKIENYLSPPFKSPKNSRSIE